MIIDFITILCLLLFIVGSITDFKWRIVPDWLSYISIVTGLAYHSFLSVSTHTWTPIIQSVLGGVLFLAIGSVLFYLKQWGGGDAKILMGFGTLVGLELTMTSMIPSFILNLVLVGGLYGLGWFLVLALKQIEEVKKETKQVMGIKAVASLQTGLIFLGVLMIVFGFFINAALPFVILAGGVLFLFYLMVVSKAVEKVCFIVQRKVSDLEEGDWIVDDIKLGKKVIKVEENVGLTKKEIKEIQSYAKIHKLKSIKIKEGIPFVPSFFLSYVITLYFGTSIVLLVI